MDYNEKKPYNRCLHCEQRGVECDGPRTAAMTLDRWCEFMRDLKEANKLTIAEISEKSGVSKRTIERILSGHNEQDIMRETARLIENAIIGSSNRFPCYMAFVDSLPPETKRAAEMESELIALKQSVAQIHDSYKTELDTVRKEAQTKIDFLKEQIAFKDEIIKKLVEKP